MLEVRNIDVSTKDNLKILNDSNLKVNDGEVVVLMGPNGWQIS